MITNDSLGILGFPSLEMKKERIITIINQYDYLSAVQAVYTINAWRNNRGSQESCLALNLAIRSIDTWGDKSISTYKEFSSFFDELYLALKTSVYDDPVLCDFGELKLNYESSYYSVITGTGHTTCVFSALQFLEGISNYCAMNQITESLLQYSNVMLNELYSTNVCISDDFSNAPNFECPNESFFLSVRKFFSSKAWGDLPATLIDILSPSDNIFKCHFVCKDATLLPLFNPSLIIDYFTNICSFVPANVTRNIVKETLARRIESIYCDKDDKLTKLLTNPAFLSNANKIVLDSNCFVYMQDKTIIVFLEAFDKCRETKKALEYAFNHQLLRVADLNETIGGDQYKAYLINEEYELSFIFYDNYINVDENRFILRERNDLRVYTAIDLMYMVLISDDLKQIVEFDKHSQDEMSVFSWGGVSDYYSVYLSQMGYISKGAIEYNELYLEIDSAASLLFNRYLKLKGVFPFQINSHLFASPEHWKITADENGINQYTRKSRKLSGGALFIYENNCVLFSSYNILSIFKPGNYQQISILLEFFRGVIERFFCDFHHEISHTDSISDKLIQLNCCSLYENDIESGYLVLKNKYDIENYISIDFSVDCEKLMTDISTTNDRTVEYSMILELMKFVLEQCGDYETLESSVKKNMYKCKTADATTVEIDYYYNTKSSYVKIEERSTLMARKKLAQIIANKDIKPGRYERKVATAIVRKMQEESVNAFEKMVSRFDKLSLHKTALSFYSSEIFSDKMNRYSFDLCTGIDDVHKRCSMEKTQKAIENSRNKQESILYLIESNLFISEHGNQDPSNDDISDLLAYAEWIVSLQNVSDLCFHTDSNSQLIILDDYRADVKLGEKYLAKYNSCNKRRLIYQSYVAKGDAVDVEFADRIAAAFEEDTGVEFDIFISLMDYLSTVGFNSPKVLFDEIKENVIRINVKELIQSFNTTSSESFDINAIYKAINYLTIDAKSLKSLKGKPCPFLPIWERENRDNRFNVRPLLQVDNDIIFSPTVLHSLKDRWISGMMQFMLPYEIGLDKTISIIDEWKKYYEHKFSADIDDAFGELGFEYHKHDVDIRREDRTGNHPSINELGDYDAIGLSKELKKIYIIECKVLHPIGSVFEHSNEQKRFFFEGKYDEKFQRRIDYFLSIYPSFFANLGINLEDCKYDVCPLLVVNKVFDSFYKDVSFPIVTFDEMKEIIQSLR